MAINFPLILTLKFFFKHYIVVPFSISESSKHEELGNSPYDEDILRVNYTLMTLAHRSFSKVK